MFTGLVEEIGEIARYTKTGNGSRLLVNCELVLRDIEPGASVAVNGLCLTAAEITDSGFHADVMPESIRRSSLSSLQQGARVNLERAMPADGRFGGHFMTGHIDGVGRVVSREREQNADLFAIAAEPPEMRYLVKKGSVSIDGISLTVAEIEKEHFWVSIVPHTLNNTTLKYLTPGDLVNIETDLIGKYVRKFFEESDEDNPNLNIELLKNSGFK